MPRPDPSIDDLAARVGRLEERLDELAGEQDRRGSGPRQDDGGRFWALEELKRRTARASVVYAGVAHTPVGDPVEWQMGFDSAELLEHEWATQASALAALGHRSRLHILQLVARGEAVTAADLAHTDGLGSTGQIYHHLRQLVAAGWLRTTGKGQHQVPPERLVPLLVILGASR